MTSPTLNWKAFLSQHDMVWDATPQRWLDGIPLANGQIGALIWGDGGPLKFTLDKYDCWERREQQPSFAEYNYANLRRLHAEGNADEISRIFLLAVQKRDAPAPTRLPLPRLELNFGEPALSFNARLHIHDAIVSGVIQLPGDRVEWVAFTHAQRNVLVVQLRGANMPQVAVTIRHLFEPGPDGGEPAWEALKRMGYEQPEVGDRGDARWMRMEFPAGGEYVIAWMTRATPVGMDIFVSIVSHNDSEQPTDEALELVMDAAADGAEKLVASHEAWWHDYWPASYLTIPDSRLENLYYVEMYKLACSSRPGGLPITLQGLWTTDGAMPPWSGDYHLDMNVQESYWPIYTANRLALGQCLYETFFNCLPVFERRCEEFFGFDGAWSGCAVSPYGDRLYGYATTEFWPGNGAWLAHMFWLHWLYTRDEGFLRERAVPFMAPFMRTYMNLLEEGPDGKLHIPLSHSPEYGEGGFAGWAADPSCDIALIRWLGSALLEANRILDLNSPEAERWRLTLERLRDYPQDAETGLRVDADRQLAHSHRHHSHLMGIYPLGILNRDDEQAGELIDRSLLRWRTMGLGQWTGWAFPWASCIAARAGLPNMAWQMLDLYLTAFTSHNSFHVNGDWREFGLGVFTYQPMTLEAGFCAAAAIMEMLLQSYGGMIRLFPALPDRWHDAYFEDLRAEGAFLVTARMTADSVDYARITSEVGGICRVLNPWNSPVRICRADGKGCDMILEAEVLEFDTDAGHTYLICEPGRVIDEGRLQPVVPTRRLDDRNWFGLKRQARF